MKTPYRLINDQFLVNPASLLKNICGLICLMLISSATIAKTHPSYLTPQYCESVVEQFVDHGMRSLGKYINENFNPEYKGGIRNTIGFLEQRSAWLNECNDYLLETKRANVFHNQQSTEEIFVAIEGLAKELQLVREGVEYPDESGANNPRPFIKRRYEELAKLVDQQHTRILMKKQFR